MFLLFMTQQILLYCCLFAGLKNNEYQRYLISIDMDFGISEQLMEIPITPRQLSLVAAVVLVLGVIAYRHQLKLYRKQIEKNTVNAEDSSSAFESIRRKKYSSLWRLTKIFHIGLLLLSIIPAIIVIPAVNFEPPNTAALIVAYLVTMGSIGGFVLWLIVISVITLIQGLTSACALRGARPTKQQILTTEIKRLFGETGGYQPFGEFHADPFETDVVKRFDKLTTNDYVFGSYKGVSFEQMDVLLYNNDSDGSRPQLASTRHTFVTSDSAHKQNGFKGRWMIVNQPKAVSGKFYIFSKSTYAEDLRRLKKLSGLSEVFLEDTDFNDQFVIYAERPHDVFYVMTPQLIERLKIFAGMRTEKPDFSIRLGFCQSRIHLVVCGLTDAFEDLFGAYNLDISVSEESARMSVRRDLNLITSFIDSLFH